MDIKNSKWEINSRPLFDTWINTLPDVVQDVITANIKVLELNGPSQGRELVDTLNGSKYPNMKEIRIRTHRKIIRIAFAFDPHRKGILLIGGDKRGVNQDRFYKDLIKKADKEYEKHLKEIKND